MVEIEFSMMTRGPTSHTHLSKLFEQFEDQYHTRIRPHYLAWEDGWAEIVKIALHGGGPDVSEIGSTWVGSLAAMNAVRPFTPMEVDSFEGPQAFIPAAWQTGMVKGEPPVWAMPWLSDTRVLYYRRDWLQQAGVDEPNAFRDPQQLEATLTRLQTSGVATPWVMPTHHTITALHFLASWVWGAGGDLFSSDGRRILFNEPVAREAMRRYFNLYRFLGPAARNLEGEQADALYRTGEAAATITGSWLYHHFEPEIRANTGIAPAPGVPFVGGSNLVVWRRTKQEREAVRLVQFLTQSSTQIALSRLIGLLPIRKDVLEWKDFAQHPLYQAVAISLGKGRSFPTLPSWGLIEDRLAATADQIWSSLLANPDLDLEATIAQHFEALAHRLSLMLASRER